MVSTRERCLWHSLKKSFWTWMRNNFLGHLRAAGCRLPRTMSEHSGPVLSWGTLEGFLLHEEVPGICNKDRDMNTKMNLKIKGSTHASTTTLCWESISNLHVTTTHLLCFINSLKPTDKTGSLLAQNIFQYNASYWNLVETTRMPGKPWMQIFLTEGLRDIRIGKFSK